MTYEEALEQATHLRKLADQVWERGDKAHSTHLHAQAAKLEAKAKLMAPRDPMRHELKCWPDPFEAIERGDKHYEIRENDRDYRVGDTLFLREWVPVPDWTSGHYTGKSIDRLVTYISYGPLWGLPEGICVMSIAKINAALLHRAEKQT